VASKATSWSEIPDVYKVEAAACLATVGTMVQFGDGLGICRKGIKASGRVIAGLVVMHINANPKMLDWDFRETARAAYPCNWP
jgi:hypothetical protein